MKYSFCLLILVLICSCKKEEATCTDGIKNQNEVGIDCGGPCAACPISYPQFGSYGLNLLHGSDTLRDPGISNSFRAVIPVGSSLRIEMSVIDGTGWNYDMNSGAGWTISDNNQTFEALNGGTTELHIFKEDGPMETGTILIKYFENGWVQTREKVLIWE